MGSYCTLGEYVVCFDGGVGLCRQRMTRVWSGLETVRLRGTLFLERSYLRSRVYSRKIIAQAQCPGLEAIPVTASRGHI